MLVLDLATEARDIVLSEGFNVSQKSSTKGRTPLD